MCRVEDLPAGRPLAARLLERDNIAVARLADGRLTALADRCLHRSTRLSIGTVEGCDLRCSYHGWTWAPDGSCTSIPSLPDGPIPSKAVVPANDVTQRHGLVWVRIERGIDAVVRSALLGPGRSSCTRSPGSPTPGRCRRCGAWRTSSIWPTSCGSTTARSAAATEPVPPLPAVERVDGELRFTYDPPDFDPAATAMYGTSAYRMPIPCTVDIEFRLEDGARRVLWMTASPIDRSTCRTFPVHGALDDDLDGDRDAADAAHVAFQRRVLAEDEPVVCAQVPGEFPLEAGLELSVSTDLVSNVYRRWVREIVRAYAAGGPTEVAAAISASRAVPSDSSSQRGSARRGRRRGPAPRRAVAERRSTTARTPASGRGRRSAGSSVFRVVSRPAARIVGNTWSPIEPTTSGDDPGRSCSGTHGQRDLLGRRSGATSSELLEDRDAVVDALARPSPSTAAAIVVRSGVLALVSGQAQAGAPPDGVGGQRTWRGLTPELGGVHAESDHAVAAPG